jgi:hypothetical protein
MNYIIEKIREETVKTYIYKGDQSLPRVEADIS